MKLSSYSSPPSTPQWPVYPSPFCLQSWGYAFDSHPDKQYVRYIHAGLSVGFRIGFNKESTSLKSSTRNHPSAAANKSLVSEYIKSEVELGRLVGPLPEDQIQLVKVSPIGLIPKPNQVGKWRLIMDLSYPRDHSVNVGISEDLASITYAHVDDAVECIKTLGVGTLLIKVDLEMHIGIYLSIQRITIYSAFHGKGGHMLIGLSHLVCALPPRYSQQLQT